MSISKSGVKTANEQWSRDRWAICRRCRCRITDAEPYAAKGMFYHPKAKPGQKPCINDGMVLVLDEEMLTPERKRDRRAQKRAGRLARKLRPQ